MSQMGDEMPLDLSPGTDILEKPISSRAETTNRKRSRQEHEQIQKPTTRRRVACQQCRARKIKCDNSRPTCALCLDAGRQCIYNEPSNNDTRVDPSMTKILRRLDQILERVDGIACPAQRQLGDNERSLSENIPETLISGEAITSPGFTDPISVDEMSKDYLRIPTSKTTADTILTWPIFQRRFPPEHLTDILLSSKESERDDDVKSDFLVVRDGFEPLSDERIPYLIDRFLENVHTKNPILDVDALIRYGRKAAIDGPAWDAPSCLVLLACALGSISSPFESSVADRVGMSSYTSSAKSSSVYKRELRQAESCYSLACRRLGLLKHTVLGAQCFFYSGVYLMYTFHPLESWNHFCQASTFYQSHFRHIAKSAHLPLDKNSERAKVTQRRLEQSLYWSCFKSECEIRVELDLPQSSIANVEYPHMFPSPPSHPPDEPSPEQYNNGMLHFEQGLRDYSNNALKEEKSWYYYLTEVALRRIGNRILNTFYQNDHNQWLNISALIPIAKEFEEQILVWSAHLPPSMQYDDSDIGHISPSQELSWATWNRLLELRFWLFQPFLYHAIHCDPSPIDAPYRLDLQFFVDAAMECNAETIRVRTLRHRHHGIWFDIRAIITASFSVIAAAKSGRVKVHSEWEDRIEWVIATLAFWEDESPDLIKSRRVLEELFAETLPLIRAFSR